MIAQWFAQNPDEWLSKNAPEYLMRFYGSFWPFTVTRTDRIERGDPRPSMEERYSNKKSYLDQVMLKTNKLLEERFLIREDADKIIAAR